MADITTRETSGGGATVKGSPLTNSEVDTNFINLNADKVESGGDATLADVTVDSLQFTGGTGTQGTVSWNVDEETLDVILDGATLQMGQEVHYHVRNNTASTISNGTPVMVTGTLGASGRLTIAPMDATDQDNGIYYIGVTTEDIAANADGKATHFGKIRHLDTSAYADGDLLWLSTSTVGAFTTTEPSTGIKIPAAIVIKSHAQNGTLFCRYQGGYGIHDMHDFDASVTPVDNDVVAYDATSGNYQPQSAAEAGLATAAQGSLADTALQPADLTVTTNAAGTAALTYTSGTGVFSYTPPDLSSYLTSYTETDTLDSVTDRGATTTNAITVGGITSTGNVTASNLNTNDWDTAYGWGNHASAGYYVNGTTGFASTGIDDNATSTAITIDSSENVGIGGASNGGNLQIYNDNGGSLWLTDVGSRTFGIQTSGTNLVFRDESAATERMRINSSGTLIHKAAAVFNEDGGDSDFRIESDGNTHMLFVDAGNNHVNIGQSTDSNGLLNVAGITVSDAVDNGFRVVRGSPAYYGQMWVNYEDSKVNTYIDSIASTSFVGQIIARTSDSASTITEQFKLSNGVGAIFNESGANLDFRVESDSSTHALFVDATNGNIGINDSAPSSTLASGVSATGRVLSIASGGTTAISIRANDSVNDRNAVLEMLSSGNGGSNNIIVYGDTDTTPSTKSGLLFQGYHNGSRVLRATLDWSGQWINQIGAIFNDSGADSDFRVESDSNANMFVVDAGLNEVIAAHNRMGAAPTAYAGEMVHFNTNMRTVGQGATGTYTLFTRSPDANVAVAGTCYIGCENSGADVQWGYIVDFFMSNGSLSTSARATGNSQGTTSVSIQESGANITVSVTYAGGLGGNIRFNASGFSTVASY